MSERKIKVVIGHLGKVTVEAVGFQGTSCADATRAIEGALQAGTGTFSKEFKPEWHEAEDVVQVQEQSW